MEASSPLGWERYTGSEGAIIGLSRFGLSAPAKDGARHFGFEPERIVGAAKEQLFMLRKAAT